VSSLPAGASPASTAQRDGVAALELRNVHTSGWQALEGADDVTFRNVSSGNMFIYSASHVNVLGGEVGPGQGLDYDSQISTAGPGDPPPTDITIDGVWFHDWWRQPGTDYHTECLQLGAFDEVQPPEAVVERALEVARELAELPAAVYAPLPWPIQTPAVRVGHSVLVLPPPLPVWRSVGPARGVRPIGLRPSLDVVRYDAVRPTHRRGHGARHNKATGSYPSDGRLDECHR